MTPTPKKKRIRRTAEQMISDLEAEIARVKARAAAKEAKAAPEGKPFLAAVKGIDKAIEAAEEAGNKEMVTALEAGRAPLSELMVKMGLKAPASRPTRGRRKRTTVA